MKGKISFMWRATLALVLVLSLGVVMAAPVSAAGTLTVSTVVPDNPMAGATTTYPIEFTTDTAYVIDSVEMEFATGFDVSGAALSGTATGIGEGTVTSALQVVTYTVTEPEVIGATTTITITLSGIVNPAAGDYSLTVRTKSGAATIDEGTSTDFTIDPAPVSFLVVPDTVTAGDAFFVTITAKDAADGGGAVVTGYNGVHLIDFSSTASEPKTIPAFAEITFDDGAGGVGTSLTEFVLNVVETEKTITATDSEINVTGTSSEITVGVAALGYLTITGAPASVTAGEAFVSDVTVTAYDAEGNAKTDDTSSVSWSGGGAGAVVPGAENLVAGTYTFDGAGFTLETAGSQTITVTDGTISGDAFITVNPAAADSLTVAVDPATIDADGTDASTITATVEDEFPNVDTNYTESVTFATSFGTLSDVSANFVAGVATATLTSTKVGTATILVTSGTLSDTETVTLSSALLAEVWVAIDGSDTNAGTETSPVKTISDAITKVAAGGTIEVGPGTYTLSATLTIPNTKDGLTLKSTGGAAVTTIVYDGDVIHILDGADDVTVEDFTIDGVSNSSGIGVYINYGTEGATVRNNIITNANHAVMLTYDNNVATTVVVGATVSGNVIEDCYSGIDLQGAAKDCTIADNTITDGEGRGICLTAGTLADPTQGNAITGNTITGCGDRGIWVKEGRNASNLYDGTTVIYLDDNLIDGNTVSGGEFRGIQVAADDAHVEVLVITNLVITRNNVTGNIGGGILIDSWSAVDGAGNVINFNNITGNTDFGIVATFNPGADVIDATNNWWGSVVGAEIHRMIDEDALDDVDYGSWLNAPHAIPDITLATGWNLISLPLLPTDPDIDTVLVGADVTVNKVAYFTGGPAGGWLSWFPSPTPIDLYTMNDGKGYWIDVSAGGSLAVTGVELALPGQVPPTYDVVVGWNLIGFTSTAGKTVDVYLGSVLATVEAMYGYNAVTGLYQNIVTETLLVPGNGYWLAVNTAGKIYP